MTLFAPQEEQSTSSDNDKNSHRHGARRRSQPNFLLPAEPPCWGSQRDKMPYRDRIRAWNNQVIGELNAFPYGMYVLIVAKVFIYLWVFDKYLLLRNDNAEDLKEGEQLGWWFRGDNPQRFLLYNILGDVVGLNSSGGPLGMRFKWYAGTWYNLIVPGSITCPLLPGISAKRHVLQSVGFVVYLGLLVRAIRAPLITLDILLPIVVTLALLTPFDFVIFQASRGEHSGYLLVCSLTLYFQQNVGLAGMRCCQAALWSWAGCAKVGPWFKYINGFMMPHSKFLAILAILGVPVSTLLFRDLSTGSKRNVHPSNLLENLAHMGCFFEFVLGPLNLFFPKVGVPLAIVFHSYILSMTPFASVNEWNVFCIYLTLALFSNHHSQDAFAGYTLEQVSGLLGGGIFQTPIAMALSCFLILVLILVPLYGQLYPKKVPFLTAFRPYAGNWRFVWHIVSKPAKDKLRKLRCLEGVFVSENARFVWGTGNPHFCEQIEDYFTGNMIYFPHYRPFIPMIEKLQERMGWKIDDYCTLFHEPFLNSVMGWSLATGYYVNEAYMSAVVSTCEFEENECFVAIFEPQGMMDHTSEWHLVDICHPSKKIYHGKCPYKDLEDMQPCDMSVKMFDECSILPKKKSE